MESSSNMKFDVNPDAVVFGLINGEVQGRMVSISTSRGNKGKYQSELKKYEDAGIVNATPSIISFMRTHPEVFKNENLISNKGNIFEEYLTLAPLSSNDDYQTTLKNRMTIGHGVTDEQMQEMDGFFTDMKSLAQAPDVVSKIEETKANKRRLERVWELKEKSILKHIECILGYKPESVGQANVYVMYPNYDTHRSCQLSGNRTFLFLGKRGKDIENKMIAHLSHQAVHQPLLPYKPHMTKEEKEKFHCFIKFLTDKEIYSKLSGKSSLAITTPKENHKLMAKVYPYWLGYKYRRVTSKGVSPVEEIRREIATDKAYFDSLPKGSKERKRYEAYDFENLDPEKISKFFRYKKGMTPYDFAKINFDNRDAVLREGIETNVTKVSSNKQGKRKTAPTAPVGNDDGISI